MLTCSLHVHVHVCVYRENIECSSQRIIIERGGGGGGVVVGP